MNSISDLPSGRHQPDELSELGTLAALGWDAHFARALALAAPGQDPARVLAHHRGRYRVAGADLDFVAVPSSRVRSLAGGAERLPAVGDWVTTIPGGPGGARLITDLLPRRSAFVRKAAGSATEAQVVAANVDVALVLAALPDDVNPRRLERYLSLAWESGAVPVLVLTKTDLCPDVAAAEEDARLLSPGLDVVALSAVAGNGLEELAKHLRPGRTAVLLGSSGAGKSTLANRLLGQELQRTSPVRDDGRGRHTTTHRELLRLPGGALLIDTPGLRELQLWSAGDGLRHTFGEIEELAASCRFRDCGHRTEPGCAVRAAVEAGSLDPARVAHWHALRRELAYLERRQDERAAAEQRARVRAVHRAMRRDRRDGRDR